MKEYIERFLTALETIAACMQKQANPLKEVPAGDPPAGEDLLAMPGQNNSPAVRKPRTAKAAGAPAAAAPAAAAASTAAPAAAASDKPVQLADVAEYVRKLVSSDAKDGHNKAVSVLAKFGAKRISEVKAEDFPKVIAEINAVMGAKK